MTAMRPALIGVVVVLQLSPQPGSMTPGTADVARLVRTAERLRGEWPCQPPPPIPEVAVVARHGQSVVPLLLGLLSDDRYAERNGTRWKVAQQASLALCRIYDISPYCGRAYCDGDSPERIHNVKDGWLTEIAWGAELKASSARTLLDRFKREQVFWRQFEIGQALAAKADRGAIRELESWLTLEDRHARGNAAFVLARLGDPRGFDTIARMLADRSPRSPGAGVPGGTWTLDAQIKTDRYYAAHLLEDVKDRRAVPLLIPLLNDRDVNAIVPWSLARIGDRQAISPLLAVLGGHDASMRVPAIYALEQLHAREALPRLRELRRGHKRTCSFGELVTVAEAARRAIVTISQLP